MNPLSRSMHEMCDIPDLNASYADAMEDMNVNGKKVTPPSPPEDMNGNTVTPPPEEARDDDCMFIDESSPLRSVGAAKSTRPIQGRAGGSSTSLRWSMSMARLPSEVERQKKSFSLHTMVPDMHSTAIEEEEDNTGYNDAVPDEVCLDKSLYKGQQLEVRPTKDLIYSANRRPSRRGGPLKSSLKSSLRSSLKSSLRTSQTSIASNLSVYAD